VARGVVDGIVAATTETGGNVSRVATAAVRSAIKVADEVGTDTAQTVADVLAGAVRGIKGVHGETVCMAVKESGKKTAKKSVRKPAERPVKKTTTMTLKK
jgi:hypothetical protein